MEHDVAMEGHIRLGVYDGGALSLDSARTFARVRGTDLRRVAHCAGLAREEHPGVDILVDIDAMVEADAAAARARVAAQIHPPCSDTLLYIGTPAGLAGLITDMYALGICDGAVLRPLIPGLGVSIRDRVRSELTTMTPGHVRPAESRPA